MESAKKIAKRHMEKELEDEKNGKGVVVPDHMLHQSNLGVSHDKSHDQKPESSEEKIINQSYQVKSKSHTPQLNRLTKPTRKIPTKPVELKGKFVHLGGVRERLCLPCFLQLMEQIL